MGAVHQWGSAHLYTVHTDCAFILLIQYIAFAIEADLQNIDVPIAVEGNCAHFPKQFMFTGSPATSDRGDSVQAGEMCF